MKTLQKIYLKVFRGKINYFNLGDIHCNSTSELILILLSCKEKNERAWFPGVLSYIPKGFLSSVNTELKILVFWLAEDHCKINKS